MKKVHPKKNENTNVIKARQIELLKKYHEIDEEKKLVIVKLSYKNVDEILMDDHQSKEHPEFNPEVLSRISQIISHIPLGYKIDLRLSIDDYGGFDPDLLLESLNDRIEMSHYSSLQGVKRNGIRIALLLIAGIVALVFKILAGSAGWFGEGVSNELASEIIDIVGWVFIWEAVSIMFLSPSEERTRTIQFRTRIDSISFIDGNDGEVVSSEKCEKVFEQWAEESKLKKLSRNLLLTAGSGFLTIAISSLIVNLITVFDLIGKESPLYITIVFLVSLIFFVITVIAGIGAISRYIGYGPFQKSVAFFAVACLFISITSIILSFVGDPSGGFNAKTFVSGLFSLIFYVMYVFGWIFSFKRD